MMGISVKKTITLIDSRSKRRLFLSINILISSYSIPSRRALCTFNSPGQKTNCQISNLVYMCPFFKKRESKIIGLEMFETNHKTNKQNL